MRPGTSDSEVQVGTYTTGSACTMLVTYLVSKLSLSCNPPPPPVSIFKAASEVGKLSPSARHYSVLRPSAKSNEHKSRGSDLFVANEAEKCTHSKTIHTNRACSHSGHPCPPTTHDAQVRVWSLWARMTGSQARPGQASGLQGRQLLQQVCDVRGECGCSGRLGLLVLVQGNASCTTHE